MKLKLLLVQIEAITGDIDSNIEKVKKLLKDSGETSSDLIIMPELWTTGWDCPNFNKYSEELYSSKTYNFLKQLAVEYNSYIIGGSSILHKNDEKDRNTCLIFNRKGNLITSYDKFHLFSHRGQSEGIYLEEGDSPLIVNTDIGKIGVSICYDIRFPEMFRLYTYSGADFIVNVAAWPQSFMEEYISLTRARAVENQIYVVCSCMTGKINDSFNFSGHSMVIDYKGRYVDKLEREEKVLTSFIDLNEMKEYRKQMPILEDTKKCYKLRSENEKNI